MYEKLRGIVLNTIRYSDKHNIVHIYTDGCGLMSFAVPLGKTQSARMRNAMLMPLSLVTVEAGVREPEGNEYLFRYIEQSVQLLEQMPGQIANFHICFLFHLGAHLGIQPNLESYQEGYWFDMTDGVFAAAAVRGHMNLQPQEAQVIHLLSRMTFANMSFFRFNRDERNRMLDVIISYYRLHNAAIGTLRSPDILKQLFI